MPSKSPPSTEATGDPWLPPGRHVDLPGRGTTFVRQLDGPHDLPVFLLHGWTVSADLNWVGCYRPVADRHPVVALDHRGHGRGIRSDRRFRLSDCADDVVALADKLGIERFMVVGYSMGGCIAQLAALRHPDRVAGLVLSATAAQFGPNKRRRATKLAVPAISQAMRLVPAETHERLFQGMVAARAGAGIEGWPLEEVKLGQPRAVLEAGAAILRFSSTNWVGELDVPAAVVVTSTDTTVSPRLQQRLADGLVDATVHRAPGDHASVVTQPGSYVPVLLDAIASVEQRIARQTRLDVDGFDRSDP